LHWYKVLNEITNNKTEIQPLRKFNEFTLVKVSVKEATRHQIRALLSHINHPIAGDKLYGKKDNFDRLMLRCQRVNINDTICSSKYLKRFIRICKDKAFLKSN
jgi:23S rRNA-/tRNA-specific pseudouridylate synthase